MSDDAIIDAFTDAIREKLEVDEFERLMTGKKSEGGLSSQTWDYLDLLTLGCAMGADESSALVSLRGSLALDRLRARHPELWEQAALGVESD